MSNLKIRLVLFFLTILPVIVFGSEIKGRVLDDSTNNPIPDVNIYIPSLKTGVVSDGRGFFTISGEFGDTTVFRFTHIAYYPVEIQYRELVRDHVVRMRLRSIPMNEIEVIEEREEYRQDLPGNVTVLDKIVLERTRYPSMGNLLGSQPSVSIESSGPGEQTVSIRGSNPDQVVVLLDGIPLNNSSTDVADLSWIDVNDISEIQLIKSSQSSVFGSGAVGGALNIKSKAESAHLLTLDGRIGDHDVKEGYISLGTSGDYSGIIYSGSYKSSLFGKKRDFTEYRIISNYHRLQTYIKPAKESKFNLAGLALSRQIENTQGFERTLEDRKHLSIEYVGDIPLTGKFGSYLFLRESSQKERFYNPGGAFSGQARKVFLEMNDSYRGFKLNKGIQNHKFLLHLGLEYWENDFSGNERNEFIKQVGGLDVLRTIHKLERNSFGFFTVFKKHTVTGGRLLSNLDFDLSFRSDKSITKRKFREEYGLYPDSVSGKDDFSDFGYRLGVEASGKTGRKTLSVYFINGRNSRLPALNDLFLNDLTGVVIYNGRKVSPEKVLAYEVGVKLGMESAPESPGWEMLQVQFSLFKNSYVDKIYHKPIPFMPPVTLNEPLSSISGFDASFDIWLMKKSIQFSIGSLWIRISRKDLFPNKPETKYYLDMQFSRWGFNANVRYFYESEQYGFAFIPGGTTVYGSLASRKDADVILNYSNKINTEIEGYFTISALNILAKDKYSSFISYFDRERRIQINLGFNFF